jgi:hypothetical protein
MLPSLPPPPCARSSGGGHSGWRPSGPPHRPSLPCLGRVGWHCRERKAWLLSFCADNVTPPRHRTQCWRTPRRCSPRCSRPSSPPPPSGTPPPSPKRFTARFGGVTSLALGHRSQLVAPRASSISGRGEVPTGSSGARSAASTQPADPWAPSISACTVVRFSGAAHGGETRRPHPVSTPSYPDAALTQVPPQRSRSAKALQPQRRQSPDSLGA